MDVNQSSFAYAGTAATANAQTQTTQKAAREESDEVRASTANSEAVSSTDVGDVQETESQGDTTPVVESDPPADTTSEREQSPGDNVDISV